MERGDISLKAMLPPSNHSFVGHMLLFFFCFFPTLSLGRISPGSDLNVKGAGVPLEDSYLINATARYVPKIR